MTTRNRLQTIQRLAGEEKAIETDVVCDKCGGKMQVKTGRYGKFLGCSNYPSCTNTQPLTTGVKCPEKDCGGDIVERKSKRGRIFFGCSNYPKCEFAVWDKPINQACRACGNPYVVEKNTKAKGLHLYCPKCKTVSYPEPKEVTSEQPVG